MNQNNLTQIFTHYIERFEELNNSINSEYYKWEIAMKFRPMMDEALTADILDFPAKLRLVRNITENLIDSYTQPFSGLCYFAEKNPSIVRKMFLDLYRDDGGDLDVRMEKIHAFLMQSRELRDQYKNGSFLYNDDFHSVTCYLFLYDPDHNYIYKATNAHEFADCAEFYDDWGGGDNVRLDVYYRMCDELVAEMKADEDLMKTDATRFSVYANGNNLYPDSEKHVLAVDIIYCCLAYGLFDGISYSKLNSKEKHIHREKAEKAKKAEADLAEAMTDEQKLEEALFCLQKAFSQGKSLTHTKFGQGIITSIQEDKAEILFEKQGMKVLSLSSAIGAGAVLTESEKLIQYQPILKRAQVIRNKVKYAREEVEKYRL